MTIEEARSYAKTCIENVRGYDGNEQFIQAMDMILNYQSGDLERIANLLDRIAETQVLIAEVLEEVVYNRRNINIRAI